MREYKQYLLIRQDLPDIPLGKFYVHCAHSSNRVMYNRRYHNDPIRFEQWWNEGQTKIAKRVKTLQKLKNIIKKAKEKGFPWSMPVDVLTKKVFVGCVGPITEEEARKIGILRLRNV